MSREEIELMKRRAKNFIFNARHLIEEGIYDLAAFNAEQAAQLYLKATLLELIGDYPRTHSLITLLSELRRVNEGLVTGFVRENRLKLHALEDAYLTSRYFLKEFDEDDAKKLLEISEEVIKLCEELRHKLGES
ncbi:MAG TPA: HEPN domain-containing protein [Nitrososphaeria archaeon]|nr:HEPN domain-containing protein [Nitrososphaeria archaeon]